jgi:hypothetical protein
MSPLVSRLDVVRHAVRQKAVEFKPELPERPEPAVTEADESAWLFDTSRSYMDQLAFYRRQKQNGDGMGEHQ